MISKTSRLLLIPAMFAAALAISACSSDPMMKKESMDEPMMDSMDKSMDKGMDKKMDDSMHESMDMKM